MTHNKEITMQTNTLTARYCGLSPVRIQEALFIGRSLERCRKFQAVVDAIQKKGYNASELFTNEPPEVYADISISRPYCYSGGNGN